MQRYISCLFSNYVMSPSLVLSLRKSVKCPIGSSILKWTLSKVHFFLSNSVGIRISFLRVGSHISYTRKKTIYNEIVTLICSFVVQYLLSFQVHVTPSSSLVSIAVLVYSVPHSTFFQSEVMNKSVVSMSSKTIIRVYITCPCHIVNVRYCVFFLFLNTYVLSCILIIATYAIR